MKVPLGHLDWRLDTKDPHSDPADKFFGSVYCQQSFKVIKAFVKNGVKTSVAGSCTNMDSSQKNKLINKLDLKKI